MTSMSPPPSPLEGEGGRGDEGSCTDSLSILTQAAPTLNIFLSPTHLSLFSRYCALILDANSRFNLTAHRTPDSITRALLLDSLALEAALPPSVREASSLNLIDIGSGAGIPGIPLKILHSGWQLVLVESVGKKARFLEGATRELALEDVAVLNRRAEDIGADRTWRDTFQLVIARAVAPLSTVLELCAPLAAPGAILALPKGRSVEDELATSTAATRALRLELLGSPRVPPELGLRDGRVVLLYRKTGPTPSAYPRRVGLARSRPIGVGR